MRCRRERREVDGRLADALRGIHVQAWAAVSLHAHGRYLLDDADLVVDMH